VDSALATTSQISLSIFGEVAPITASGKSPSKPPAWRSSGPNAINVNFASKPELIKLCGNKTIAEAIAARCKSRQGIDSLAEIMDVAGVTEEHYRRITGGLEPGTEVWTAEETINTLVGLSGYDISMRQVSKAALSCLNLDGMFVSSSDGMVLAGKTDLEEVKTLKDALVAVAPQLCQRLEKTLQQASLPAAPTLTIPFASRSITFGGSGAAYVILIHKEAFPAPENLSACRDLASAISWYYSERGVC
jgi:hypothetical protein